MQVYKVTQKTFKNKEKTQDYYQVALLYVNDDGTEDMAEMFVEKPVYEAALRIPRFSPVDPEYKTGIFRGRPQQTLVGFKPVRETVKAA